MKFAGTGRHNTFFRSLVIMLTTASICNNVLSEEVSSPPTTVIKVTDVNQTNKQQVVTQSEGSGSNTFNIDVLLGEKIPANDKATKNQAPLVLIP
jgi:hypothetical protein